MSTERFSSAIAAGPMRNGREESDVRAVRQVCTGSKRLDLWAFPHFLHYCDSEIQYSGHLFKSESQYAGRLQSDHNRISTIQMPL